MSDTESVTVVPESVKPTRKKREFTPEMAAKLALAREKAAEVKAKMKEAKTEIQKLQPPKRNKLEELTRQLEELKKTQAQPASPPPTSPPAKPAKKKKPVVILEHSSSDDEPAQTPVVYVRKKKKAPPAPEHPPVTRMPRYNNPFFNHRPPELHYN
jgi:hypothetical protein